MKHAVCVIGYGDQADVLQKTINILDNKDINFFVHWDARYKIPNLHSKLSKIFYVDNRIPVKWGGQSQIQATLLLLKLVQAHLPYDYVHLISCNDIPLMTKDFFINYFSKDVYIGYNHRFTNQEIRKRIGFFYPNIDFRNHKILTQIFKIGNKILNINRIKKHPNVDFKKGPQWFSIKSKYIPEIIHYNNSIFMHGYFADELFIQTILGRFDIRKNVNDNYQAARYIDWQRGTPYVFSAKDVKELKSKVNTQYAFARKINDPKIIDYIFNSAH